MKVTIAAYQIVNFPIVASVVMLVYIIHEGYGDILQPSVGNKDVILERKPSNKDQNTPSNGPAPVIHKQVGFQVNIWEII